MSRLIGVGHEFALLATLETLASNSGKQSGLEIHSREHFARNQKFLESAEHLVRVQV